MIKSSYLSYLLSLIKTKTYAEEVINNLDELKDALYNRRVDLDKRMGELFSFEMKEKIKAEDWKMFINQVRKSKQIEQKAEDGSQKTDKSDGLSNSLPEFHSPSSGLSG